MFNQGKYHSVFSNSPLSNFICEPRTLQIWDANNTAVNNYGYSLTELQHLSYKDLAADTELYTIPDIKKLEKQEKFSATLKNKTRKGDTIITDTNACIIEYNHKQAVLITANDITEKIKQEELVNNQKKEHEKYFREALLHSREIETVGVRQELNDEIGQLLVSVKFYQALALQNDHKRMDFLIKGSEILNSAIIKVRSLSKNLGAPGINDLYLYESVQELVNTINEGTTINISLVPDTENNELPAPFKQVMCCNIHEYLRSIIRKEQAKNITINIVKAEACIKLVIEDDSNRYSDDDDECRPDIDNIILRTGINNGKVTLEATPGIGCRLVVTLPVN